MSNDRKQRAARAEQMRKEREKAEKRQRNVITIAILVVVVALVGLAFYAFNSYKSETDVIAPKGATKDYGVVYTPKDAGGQAKGTPVRVTIYEDMQCPVCKAFEQAYGATLDSMVKSGEIEIEYRLLSFLDRPGGSPNEYAKRAGSAALCAFVDGGPAKFKQVHDALYQNQPEEGTEGPSNQELLDRVKAAGVTGADSCVLKARYAPWVDQANDAARDADVTGTPTVEVAGKKVEGAQGGVPTMDRIQQAIAAAKKG
ncbi:MAG: thioredoxin domain-containing protein [Aeromicrobium erythreum]